jgi:argininosuccinate synthase
MNRRSFFVLAALLLAAAGLYVQSRDSAHAKTLAQAITQADISGAATTLPASQLQAYVKAHMGTTVSYSLTGSYDRAVAAAKSAASAEESNQGVYAAAQAACTSHANSIVQAECNQAYLQSHMSQITPPAPVPAPKLAAYRYTDKAAFWTPDLAGALMLGAIAALIVGVLMKPRRYR